MTTNRHDDYQQIIESIRQNLVEFGYDETTTEMVLSSYDKAISGKPPVNIIDMLTNSLLKQNGFIS